MTKRMTDKEWFALANIRDAKREAEVLATEMYAAYRMFLRASPKLRAYVKAQDPYMGHPAQVAANLNSAAYYRRWYQILRASSRTAV